MVKNREIFHKKEIAEMFNNYFVNIGLSLPASIPESKMTFQNYIHYEGPYLSIIDLTDLEWKMHLQASKQTKVQGMMIYLPCCQKSVR